MRRFIDAVLLNEKVVDLYSNAYDASGRTYPVHRNGSARDLRKLRDTLTRGGDTVRAFLAPNGDLYFWDAYAAAHVAMRARLGIRDGINLYLDPDGVRVSWSRRREVSQDEQAEAEGIVRANPNIRNLYGRTVPVTAELPVMEGSNWFGDGVEHIWIDDTGKVIDADDHHAYASAEFGNDEFDEDDDHRFTSAVRSAIAAGWVRVMIGENEFIGDYSPAVTNRAKRALARLIRDTPDKDRYRICDQFYDVKREAIRAANTTE